MIRLKRHRLAYAVSVVGFGAASGTAEFGFTGQFTEQSGVGHYTYLCIFASHIHTPPLVKITCFASTIIPVSSKNG
jgi:hypothetical protein